MSRPIPIAVRDFALPAPRTGSIEVHSGYRATTEQGVEIHVAIQAERSRQIEDYAAEVPLAHVFTIGKLSFRVGGRIDGIVPGQPPILEEIKSAFDAEGLARRLEASPDHPYRLQLQLQMNQPPRRNFMISLVVTGAALVTRVEAQALVDEKDAQAAAQGYVADAKRVDVKKFPKFVAGQHCGNCALYQGKATDKTAGCTLFAGKLVAGAGWCSAWAKKA